MSGSLTGAILSVLAVSDKPMTSYEVFELLPDIGRTIYPNQVKSQLKTLATRNKVMVKRLGKHIDFTAKRKRRP